MDENTYKANGFTSQVKTNFEEGDAKAGIDKLLVSEQKRAAFKNTKANYGKVKLKKKGGAAQSFKKKKKQGKVEQRAAQEEGQPFSAPAGRKHKEVSSFEKPKKSPPAPQKKRTKTRERLASKKEGLLSQAKHGVTKPLSHKAVDVLAEDEDLEALQHFQTTYEKGQRSFKTVKRVHHFASKEEKFGHFLTRNKARDLRFSGPKTKSKPAQEASRGIRKSLGTAFRELRNRSLQAVQKMVTFLLENPKVLIFLGAVCGALAFLAIGVVIASMLFGGGDDSSSVDGIQYVKHWDGHDAYHSSYLAQRYGIKAEQIDGFIKSQGYDKVDERATGKEFLRLQKLSGIDVRALVAFGQMESSFGTAGVAAQYPKGNIFGFGSFDNDPNQGANWDNTRAVKEFRSHQIDELGNKTLAIMDERASAFANGTLKPGQGVYWTALYSGKKRATIMQDFDMYIDGHGGTPEPPGGYGPIGGGGAAGIKALDEALGKSIMGTYGGGDGQCYALTSFYAHSVTPDIPNLVGGMNASNIGSDYPWDKWGWKVVNNPGYDQIKNGDIINFAAGADMGGWRVDPNYGHTGVVGKILGDERMIIYDQNPGPAKTWTWTYTPHSVASVIHPPKD